MFVSHLCKFEGLLSNLTISLIIGSPILFYSA
nr:MAG TPA: hypothetical protein [Bacteriophage sp.]